MREESVLNRAFWFVAGAYGKMQDVASDLEMRGSYAAGRLETRGMTRLAKAVNKITYAPSFVLNELPGRLMLPDLDV